MQKSGHHLQENRVCQETEKPMEIITVEVGICIYEMTPTEIKSVEEQLSIHVLKKCYFFHPKFAIFT